ncbi:hypothetical protein [Clostridium perfringens]|uniref:hypothetical protein n=1 Tax=Clostridium perfringens TaxID=1502 RepID=UPI002B21B528|nr:hypothetical protein [Clostridium perfringens]MEA5268659.1 hypothetical protein [Clostridium perfringens]MEA5380418.1 hypothetical protein [Clostridium perfringens]
MCDKGPAGPRGHDAFIGCVLEKELRCEKDCQKCRYSYKRRIGFEKIPTKITAHAKYTAELVVHRGYERIHKDTDFSEIFKVSRSAIGYYCIDHIDKLVWIEYEPGELEEKCNLEDIKVTLEVDFREIKVK